MVAQISDGKIKSSISSSGITSDSLDTIISKYPELLAYSDDMQGILSAIDNLLYEQKDAAQVAGDALLDYSTVIYDQVVSSIYEDCANANSNLINELAQGYNIDLNNFSSLAQAKEAIDTQLLQTLMEMWGKYYGIVVDSVTGLASVTQNLPDFYQNEEAQNQLATYNQIITKLNATNPKSSTGLNIYAWQYTSSGQVPGISGNVDINILYGNTTPSTNYSPSVTETLITLMGRVNTSSGNLNIRSLYSSSSSIVGKYSKNEIVQLIAKTSNGWYRTDKGYISSDYVIGVQGEVFNCSKLNIRSTATSSVQDNKIGILSCGDKVQLLKEDNGWYKVKTDNNVIGYVSKKYIKILG